MSTESGISPFRPLSEGGDGSGKENVNARPTNDVVLLTESVLKSNNAKEQRPDEAQRLTTRNLKRHTSSLPSSPRSERISETLKAAPKLDPTSNFVQATGASVDAWYIPFSQAIEAERALKGPQDRDLTVVHDCKGIDSAACALDTLAFRWRYLAASDPKEASFLAAQQNYPAEHFFNNSRSLCLSHCCCLHRGNSTPCIDWSQIEQPDLYIAGFPCQPFTCLTMASLKGPMGYKKHKLFGVSEDVLFFMGKRQPRKVILENVFGMTLVREADQISPLEDFLGKLEKLKMYVYKVIILNGILWVQMTRKRIWIIAVLNGPGAEAELDRIYAFIKEICEYRSKYGPPVEVTELVFEAQSPELKNDLASLSCKPNQELLVASYCHVIDDPEKGPADVHFLVGGKNFGGLRCVLCMRCEVLQKMLTGEFQEAQDLSKPIKLPDFDHVPNAFRQFLFYLHAGSSSLDNVLDVIGLYEISKYYGVAELMQECLEFLNKSPILDDVCVELLNFALKHEAYEIAERVAQYIVEHADTAFTDAKRAAELPMSFLRFVCQAGDISIPEIALVRITLEIPAEKQDVLRPLIRLTRVPAMDMMKVVVPSGLFDNDVCLAAIAYREDPLSVELSPEMTKDRVCSIPRSTWGRDYLATIGAAVPEHKQSPRERRGDIARLRTATSREKRCQSADGATTPKSRTRTRRRTSVAPEDFSTSDSENNS